VKVSHYNRYALEQLGDVFQGVLVQTRYADQTLRVINSRDVYDGSVGLEPGQVQTIMAPSDLARQSLRPLDVLITVRNQPVRAGLWMPVDDRAVAAQNLAVWRITDLHLDPAYALLYLNSADGQRALNFAVSPSRTVPFLSLGSLRKLEIPVPPLRIQHHLVQLEQSIREAEKSTLEALKGRRAFLQTVIHQTLGGK